MQDNLCPLDLRNRLTRAGRRRPLRPGFSVHGATGHNLHIIGLYDMLFEVQGRKFRHTVLVVKDLQAEAIMGWDLLSSQGVNINGKTQEVTFHPAQESGPQLGDQAPLRMRSQTTVPARQAVWVQALCAQAAQDSQDYRRALLCQGEQLMDAVNTPAADGTVSVLLINNDFAPRRYKQGDVIGEAEFINNDNLHSVNSLQNAMAARKLPLGDNRAKMGYLHRTIRHGFHGPLAKRFWDLINLYQDVFSADKYDLGKTDVIMHTVRLKGAQPVHMKQFRLPWSTLDVVNNHVTELLKCGVVQPSRSPYNSPIFCVPKKSGELRVVQDMRALNAASYEDKYAIREISECIDEIGRSHSRVFSTLDLTSGFWQLVLDPGSRECTAFTVPGRGRFEWTRCPMGLHGSPASFSRLMDIVMKDTKGILTYLDDVLVHAADQEQHLTALETAFQRLRKYNLKLNAAKCDFAAPKVPYLGVTLTSRGVTPGEDKLKAVK